MATRGHEVEIDAGGVLLGGTLAVPDVASAVVIFAHGGGSGRHSPRNQQVAAALQRAGIGTLLFDLLTREEEIADRHTGHLRFDVELLAERLVHAVDWALGHDGAGITRVGFFGASTGGGAALVAAARLQDRVDAVVSRGGRPDLAGAALARVTAPTLLIVGERDPVVLDLNRLAYGRLRCARELAVIAQAAHLFEETGALEQVAELAVEWFGRHLGAPSAREVHDGLRRHHPAA
jgi:dienelactone hydrolase